MASDNATRARELLDGLCAPEFKVQAVAQALDEAEARGAGKWRPVSERPACDNPDGRFVLMWRAGMSEPQKRWWSPRLGFEIECTHWMPLPPTPSEETRR